MDTLKVVLNKFVSHFRPHYSSTKQEVKSRGVLLMETHILGPRKTEKVIRSIYQPHLLFWFVTTLNDSVMFCIAY